MKKCCCTCRWLYIKDFITGVCNNEKSNCTVISPSNTCEYWEKHEDNAVNPEYEEFIFWNSIKDMAKTDYNVNIIQVLRVNNDGSEE